MCELLVKWVPEYYLEQQNHDYKTNKKSYSCG